MALRARAQKARLHDEFLILELDNPFGESSMRRLLVICSLCCKKRSE